MMYKLLKRLPLYLLSMLALVMICIMLPTEANAASESDLTFTLNSDGESYSVTACNTSAVGKLVIPETYNGKPVTGIVVAAFWDCTGLTGITIPDSVTSIGSSAFSGCGNLEEMTIPFVGGSQNTADIYGQPNSKIALFGYIFGTRSYEGGREVKQGFTKYTADGSLSTKEYSYTYQYSAHDGFGTPKASYTLYETLKYSSLPFNHYYSNYEKDPIAKEQELRALHYAIHKTKEVRGPDSQLKELSAKLLLTYGEPLEEYRQAYYIPETLKKVTVTNADRIYFGAFSYCDFIEEIHITKADTKIHTSVFYGAASTQVFCLRGSALEDYILDGKRISGGRHGGKYITPEKPVILDVTDETVTLQRGSNLEYSIDGENWTESNVFTGLAPDTEYTFYQRYKSKKTEYLMERPDVYVTVYSATILESDPSEGVTVTTKPSLSGISIFSLPSKLTYLETKDKFSANGGKVRLEYGDEQFGIIDLTADMVQGFNNRKVGTQTLTVTYRGFKTTFDVIIEQKSVSYISIYKAPTKNVYLEGEEELDVTGGSLRVSYNNGTVQVISLTLDMVSGFDSYKIGYQYLTVSYAGKTSSFEIYIDPIDYTITFLNWDNSVISSKIYHRGDKVSAPANPTKAADNTYTYAFAGWDKEVVPCAGDTTYTATYTPTYIDYTIAFIDRYGMVYSTQTYHWGDTVIPPEDPTKAATNIYTYTFAGWDKEVVPCAGDATYTAIFTSTYIDYTVVFKDWDGTVLSANTYHWGDWVIAPENPVREADNICSYDFAGWDKDVIKCAGDAVYTATYTSSSKGYIVTFQYWDGTILSSDCYWWGDEIVVPEGPIRAADNTYTYAFAGWDKEVVPCAGDTTYTATYTSTYIDYTVVFKDWDGTVLSANTYHWGDWVTVPEKPVRKEDNIYYYSFAGWDKDVIKCAGDAVYTATYTSSSKGYIVTFQYWDGTILSSDCYWWGDEIVVPEGPIRAADNTYTYTFAGWDKEVVPCAGDTTYTATYTSTYIDYTVVFKNWDGTILSSSTYHWGDEVTAPENPTMAADNVYSYIFAGWNKEVVNCAGDAVYIATYTPTYIDYTVIFEDWDGTVLSSHVYHWGDAVAAPADPVRAADNVYTYTFAGWEKWGVVCTGDATYTATYTSTYIDYIVIFEDWDSTVYFSYIYHWGDEVEVPPDPVRGADNTYSYAFAGWDKEVVPCAGNATYTATYVSTYIDYTIVFQDWDGTVLSSDTYHWDDVVTAPAIPVRGSDNVYSYIFAGWNKEVVNCAGNATYTATYISTYIDYTVEFQNWDGTILSSNTYHWGDEITVPANPTRPDDDKYVYTFTGWDKTVVACSGNAVYTAVYSSKTRVPSAITSSTYTISNGTISNISTGTTVSTLVGKLNEGSYVKVYNGNQEVAGSVAIGTGMVVKIMDGNTAIASYTIVVTGDTNGDGKITVTDMLAVKAHVLKKSTLSGAAAQAADTSGDNAISITDFIQMKAQILGKSNVEPRAVNAPAQQLSTASVESEASAVIVTTEQTTTSTVSKTISTLNYTQLVALIPDKKSFVTV